MREMTRKRQRFVIEYLKDQDGKAAAIRAGFSKKSAAAIASEYLTIPSIREAIDSRLREISEKAGVTAEWVTARLKLIAERCIQDIDPILTKAGGYKRDRHTGKICFDFDAAGAKGALELLGKTKGMFIDKHDVTVGGKMVIVRPKK